MKSTQDGSAVSVDAGAAPVSVSHDGQTRTAVVAFLVEHGPATAGDIGEELGMSAAGVRRHLDALIAGGEIRASAVSTRYARRGRGRPAKQFQLTSIGRGKLHHAYDDLAGAAMRRLRDVAGDQAVRDFAADRIDAIVSDVPGNTAGDSDPDAVIETADRIAVALTAAGFSANTRRVGAGVQICQHHCPVAHVATEFPELCEAETARFTDLLGTHVQRLATIANGDCACTTHVPLAVASPAEPAADDSRSTIDSPSGSDAQLASATGTKREDSR
ncbi:helix-turn-helix transcriptional regulator [Williamsia maris]|uniref:helix-turn-helix transcriptional regulator n=1 Tax=Williamsia maris TaxID=72806 RepID=UPI0020A5C2C0